MNFIFQQTPFFLLFPAQLFHWKQGCKLFLRSQYQYEHVIWGAVSSLFWVKNGLSLHLTTILPFRIHLFANEAGLGLRLRLDKWFPTIHAVPLHVGTLLDMSQSPSEDGMCPWPFPRDSTSKIENSSLPHHHLTSLHLTQYFSAIPNGFVHLNTYSRAITWCKQFLPKFSCYENTTLMGSNTTLTISNTWNYRRMHKG